MPAWALASALTATPLASPALSNVPFPRLWYRKLGFESLATNRSTQPSSS
jgi:hypothetical protein